MKRHNKNTFGEWLRNARKDAGLTQHELGARVGRTGQLISSYERGSSESKTGRPIRPEPDIVARIAYALRQPLNRALDAAGYAPVETTISPEILEASRYFEALPQESRQDILAMIKALHERRSQQQPREESPLFLQENTDTERN